MDVHFWARHGLTRSYHTTMNQTQRSRGGNYRLVQEPSVAYINAMWYTVTPRAETETEACQPVLNACCGKLTLAVWCAFLTSRQNKP